MRNMVFTKMNGETLDIWETGTEPVLGAIELDFHRLFLVNKDTRIHARKEKNILVAFSRSAITCVDYCVHLFFSLSLFAPLARFDPVTRER